MAERVGFEPTNELPRCWFSRPVLSTAQPPLLGQINTYYYQCSKITIMNSKFQILVNTNYIMIFKKMLKNLITLILFNSSSPFNQVFILETNFDDWIIDFKQKAIILVFQKKL